MAGHHGGAEGLGPIARLSVADMRAWMAHERGRGLSARSLARSLSAVKTFYRWLADREGFEPTAVLSVRAPKHRRSLPRPLAAPRRSTCSKMWRPAPARPGSRRATRR